MPTTDTPTRRPGYPRKERDHDLDRITLRVRQDLYKRMGKTCKAQGLTQRDVVEQAIRAQLKRKPKTSRPHLQRDQKLSRTGMWIDPQLLKEMDARIEQERSSQRAFIEDAIEGQLAKLDGQKTTTKKGSKNGSSKKH